MRTRPALTILLVVMLAATSAFAAQQNSGKPFAEIWAELVSLGARVVALEGGGGGALEVVDVTGAVIGEMLEPDLLLFEVGGYKVVGVVSESGFVGAGLPQLVYDAPGCTGNVFYNLGSVERTPLIRRSALDGGVGYFPGAPVGFVNIASRDLGGGFCIPDSSATWVANLETFDPDDIGTPPFALR